MEIRRNSFVYDNPQIFGVVDPNVTVEWETEDGSNTYELQKRRCEVLSAIIGGKLFDHGRYQKENMSASAKA